MRQALPDLFVQHSVHRTTAGQDQRVDCLTFRHEVCDRRSHVRENFPLEDLLPKQNSGSTLMQKRTDSSVTAPLTGWLTCEAAKSRAAARPSFPLKPRPSLKFWFNTQSRLPRSHSLRSSCWLASSDAVAGGSTHWPNECEKCARAHIALRATDIDRMRHRVSRTGWFSTSGYESTYGCQFPIASSKQCCSIHASQAAYSLWATSCARKWKFPMCT